MTIAFTPDFLDRYKIEGPLGEGGMGTVYRGEQRSLERPVAIKFLSRQLLDDEYLARFRTEAKAAAQIFHSNLVAVIETGTMEDLPYIVFELVAGTSLRAYLTDRGGTLPVQQALDFVRQAADGLACAHKAGIVHRDIKPENLLVTPDGSIKVADFGVAKAQVSPGQKTRTGLIMGTPAYLSPEQAHEKPVTPASDVWALGVVLHELIAGAQPFTRATTLELLTAIVSDPPPPLPASVPAPVAELAGRMLAKDPAQRIASMQEVSRACARLASEVGEVPALPPPTGDTTVAAVVSGARTAVVSRETQPAPVGEVTRPLTSPLPAPVTIRWPWALLAVLILLGGASRKAQQNKTVRPPPSASPSAVASRPERAGPGRRPFWRREGPLFEMSRELFMRPDDQTVWHKAVGLLRAAPLAQLSEFGCVRSPFNKTRAQICQMWTALGKQSTAEAVGVMAGMIDQLAGFDVTRRKHAQDIPVHLARGLELVFYQVSTKPGTEAIALADACLAKAGTAGLQHFVAALKHLSAGGDAIASARESLAAFKTSAAAAHVDALSIGVLDALLFAMTLKADWKTTREAEARRALADLVAYTQAYTGSDMHLFARELARAYHQALGGPAIEGLEGEPLPVRSSRLDELLALAKSRLFAVK